jgi:hypothetical protein
VKFLASLPGRLSVTGTGGISVAGSYSYDYVIGGVPFLSAATGDNPMMRETAQFRKDQQDIGREPGEQSIGDAWWRRAQDSFHGGRGLTWFESRDIPDEIARIRFQDSKNCDVWTPGVVKRLPDTTRGVTASGSVAGLVTASKAGTDYVLVATSTTLTKWPVGGSPATLTWGGSGTILSLVTDGSNYYVADSTGIYSGPVDGASNGTLLYNTGSSKVVLGWVKSRLMAAVGRDILELSAAGPTLPSPRYTHPSANWTWRCFSESPSAVLAAGDAGGQSAIHSFTLDTNGAVPVLTAASSINLPVGEIVRSLFATAGSFVGIGTSAGLRVGTFDTFTGVLNYGPLSVTTDHPVRAIAARDRFLFAGGTQYVDDESCLVRLDLGQQVDQLGRLAHASDLLADDAVSGDVSGIAVTGIGQKLVFAIDNYGVLLEGDGPGSNREAWLRTSRIRYSTTEPKLFRRLRVRGSLPDPTHFTVTAEGVSTSNKVFDITGLQTEPGEIGLIDEPQEWISLLFEIEDSGTGELRSWQMKALPAGVRQRIITLPMSCYDTEQDRNDVRFGRPGYAAERLAALEQFDDAADEVVFEEMRPSGKVTRRVLVDKLSFRQIIRPNDTSGVGGEIVLTLRTVD